MPTPRRPSLEQQDIHFSFAHGEVDTDTLSSKIFKNHPNRSLRIDKVYYTNPTGLTNDATNYFILTLKNGSTVIATWSTLTGAQGAIAANTTVALTLSSTDADLVLAPGDQLTVNFDENGTQTLPPGTFEFWGRIL